MKLCKCGCELEVSNINNCKYIKNHKDIMIFNFIKQNQGKHFCHCGCNNEIIIKKEHHRRGIPKFIRGHGKSKNADIWIKEQQDTCFCHCGCNNEIIIKKCHYYNGIPDYILGHNSRGKYNICIQCKSKINVGMHHIIPRKYGINNDKYNLIPLCTKCHDKVEILTTDWIDSGKEYSTKILKNLIIHIWCI